MNHLISTSSSNKESILSTHKTLKNTYFLLSLTLAFSTITATISTIFRLPTPGLIITIITFYGLMYITNKYSNNLIGILSTFALTGFMGYTLGPLFNMIISTNANEAIILALGGTTMVFVCSSAYVLTTKKNMSFLSGILMAGFIVLSIITIANLFLNINAISLTISTMFILFSSGTILWETSNIIHGGETNYIRATISLYVALYNIFVNLINLILNFTKTNNN